MQVDHTTREPTLQHHEEDGEERPDDRRRRWLSGFFGPLPEDLAAGGALRCLDGFSKATPAPTVVARLATGLEGLGAAMDGLGVVESLLRCESDRLIRARLSLFLRNSLEGIVTGDCGDLALCVEGEDDLEALAACSSVDLGVANKSSLDVETALLPAVLRCGLRGGCCDL